MSAHAIDPIVKHVCIKIANCSGGLKYLTHTCFYTILVSMFLLLVYDQKGLKLSL